MPLGDHINHKRSWADTSKGWTLSATITPATLLFHAKIFYFSRKYLIDDLFKYCTKIFLHAIFSFEVCATASREVVKLIEYIYANADGACGWSYGNLLTLFIGAHVVTRPGLYAQIPEFQSLLEQNGVIGAHLFHLGVLAPSCEDSFGQLILRLLINVGGEVRAHAQLRS